MMPKQNSKLPSRFEDLVRRMPPQAIRDDVQCTRTLLMINRLMVEGRLTTGQGLYLQTLVQLVQAYEAEHHAIGTSAISGLEMLRHLLDENGMNASDLARLLEVHASMGSKILKGERSLTVEHIRKLSARFKVNPRAFMD
jgi:HTH-type transcriptional regulator/antitoxin HigA